MSVPTPPLTPSSNPLLVSVVVCGGDDPADLPQTLESVYAACAAAPSEVIFVESGWGKTPPALPKSLSESGHLRRVAAAEPGIVAGWLAALAQARGQYVCFVAAGDLLHPEKFSVSVISLQRDTADVVYDDRAEARVEEGSLTFVPTDAIRHATEPADFYLRVQPPLASPLFRKSYLDRHLLPPLIEPSGEFDAAADVWLYYNLAPFPATISKIDRALTATLRHPQKRFPESWERTAVAALKIKESFARAALDPQDSLVARIVAGECAFDSWRRLPRGFSAEFQERTLKLWKKAPRGPIERLGGHFFQRLAAVFGPERAARMLRSRNHSYRQVQTLPRAEFLALLRGPK